MENAAAPKKSYTLWIVVGVVLLILVVLGVVYYYNKDFLNMAPKKKDEPKKVGKDTVMKVI